MDKIELAIDYLGDAEGFTYEFKHHATFEQWKEIEDIARSILCRARFNRRKLDERND